MHGAFEPPNAPHTQSYAVNFRDFRSAEALSAWFRPLGQEIGAALVLVQDHAERRRECRAAERGRDGIDGEHQRRSFAESHRASRRESEFADAVVVDAGDGLCRGRRAGVNVQRQRPVPPARGQRRVRRVRRCPGTAATSAAGENDGAGGGRNVGTPHGRGNRNVESVLIAECAALARLVADAATLQPAAAAIAEITPAGRRALTREHFRARRDARRVIILAAGTLDERRRRIPALPGTALYEDRRSAFALPRPFVDDEGDFVQRRAADFGERDAIDLAHVVVARRDLELVTPAANSARVDLLNQRAIGWRVEQPGLRDETDLVGSEPQRAIGKPRERRAAAQVHCQNDVATARETLIESAGRERVLSRVIGAIGAGGAVDIFVTPLVEHVAADDAENSARGRVVAHRGREAAIGNGIHLSSP